MGAFSKHKPKFVVAPLPSAVRVGRINFIALEALIAPETPYRQIVADKSHHDSSLLSGGR